jgi:hypothetical protein
MVYVANANIEPLRQSKLDLKLSIVYDHMSYDAIMVYVHAVIQWKKACSRNSFILYSTNRRNRCKIDTPNLVNVNIQYELLN